MHTLEIESRHGTSFVVTSDKTTTPGATGNDKVGIMITLFSAYVYGQLWSGCMANHFLCKSYIRIFKNDLFFFAAYARGAGEVWQFLMGWVSVGLSGGGQVSGPLTSRVIKWIVTSSRPAAHRWQSCVREQKTHRLTWIAVSLKTTRL